MEKIKRTERVAAITKVLTESPNTIINLSLFCNMFSAAKSSVSEDIAIVSESLQKFGLGMVETVSGAAGGVRFRPAISREKDRAFISDICSLLSEETDGFPADTSIFPICSVIRSWPRAWAT